MGKRDFYFDWISIAIALVLSILGLATLLSLDQSYFIHQALVLVVSLVAFWIFSRIDFSIYRYLDRHILVISLIFLAMSLLGPNIRGASSWLRIGSFQIQPSEIVKPFFILVTASLLSRYSIIRRKYFFSHMALFLVSFVLIFLQPDLGNAMVYLSVFVSLLVMAGMPLVLLGLGGIGIMTLGPLFFGLLREYQKQRLLSFLNPFLDPRGSGYNAIQSMIAVGSGGIGGRGFGRGTQSILDFLPERHTDFIFAAFVENFGLLGGLLLTGLIFALLMRMLKQVRIHESEFARLFIFGFCIQLATQCIINIGMNMGILPITGITLPFVSYGGSSLLATFIGLGIYISALQKQKGEV